MPQATIIRCCLCSESTVEIPLRRVRGGLQPGWSARAPEKHPLYGWLGFGGFDESRMVRVREQREFVCPACVAAKLPPEMKAALEATVRDADDDEAVCLSV